MANQTTVMAPWSITADRYGLFLVASTRNMLSTRVCTEKQYLIFVELPPLFDNNGPHLLQALVLAFVPCKLLLKFLW